MSLPNVLESCTVNEHNPLSCLRSGVKVLQQSVRSGCAQNNIRPWRSDFQVCSLGSIEHVDGFVGMAGAPSSCKKLK